MRSASGAAGVIQVTLALLALTWLGVFAVIGAFFMIGTIVSGAAGTLFLSPLELLYWGAMLFSGFLIAIRPLIRGRPAQAIDGFLHVVVGLAVTGLLGSIFVSGGFVVAFVLYSSLGAVLLFLMLGSLRAIGALGWRLVCGPELAGILPLGKGLVGASSVAGLAAGTAILAGADISSVADDWFYVMALPALIGFGIGAPPPRAPSLMYTAAAIGLAVCIGWAAIPVLGERHDIDCNGFTSGGQHSVFYHTDEPWRWKQPSSLREWFLTPVALAELTFWHVLDPVTEADCPAG